MKHCWKGILCVALGGIVVAALLALFPGSSEEEIAVSGEVSFSRPSGFYDEPFWLELDGNGGTVYYTLDASDPDEHSIPYTGPILIEDASAKDNVYSMNPDVSAYLYPQLLEQNGTYRSYRYELPETRIDKATVVRAVSVDASGNRSAPFESVYFVGFGQKTGYDGLNIMTVTTDPANLFDPETGIYVLGNVFWDRVEDGVVKAGGRYAYTWKGNFSQKGKDWEREATVRCFDSTGNQVFSGNYGIRIQGRATRTKLPKNLNLFARKRYGDASIDTGGLFAESYTLKRLCLYFGTNNTLLRDYLVDELVSDLDIVTRDFAPCALFLDGEYWGVYWLTERFKADYMSQRYAIDPENLVVVRQEQVDVGEKEDLAMLNAMRGFISDGDMTRPEAYRQAGELIDLESCLDYYAVEIYIANTDWPNNNLGLWRTRKPAGGPCGDCRWRWILYDVDSGMRQVNSRLDSLQDAVNQDAMFASLMENEAFAAALRDRLESLANGIFAPDAIDAFIDRYEADMRDAIVKKYERFFGTGMTAEDFLADCDGTRQFFRERYDYVVENYLKSEA